MIDQRPEDDFIEISVALGAAGSCRDRGAGGVDERGFVADRDPISALGRLLVLDSAICLGDERAEPTNSSWPGALAHASLLVTEHEPSLVASSAVCVSVGLRRSGAGIRA